MNTLKNPDVLSENMDQDEESNINFEKYHFYLVMIKDDLTGVLYSGINGALCSGIVMYFTPEWVVYFRRNI